MLFHSLTMLFGNFRLQISTYESSWAARGMFSEFLGSIFCDFCRLIIVTNPTATRKRAEVTPRAIDVWLISGSLIENLNSFRWFDFEFPKIRKKIRQQLYGKATGKVIWFSGRNSYWNLIPISLMNKNLQQKFRSEYLKKSVVILFFPDRNSWKILLTSDTEILVLKKASFAYSLWVKKSRWLCIVSCKLTL